MATERKLSTVFEMPELVAGSESEKLAREEIEFFVENGFLIKKNLIQDDDLMDRALTTAWNNVIKHAPLSDSSLDSLSRDDPQSWFDPCWEKTPPPATSGFYEGRQRFVYDRSTVKLHDIGHLQVFLDLLPNNAKVRHVAKQLLGPNLRASKRTRGVYALFPRREAATLSEVDLSGNMLGPHSDRVCQQLNLCTYLDEVPPRGGGFTVYPGSHKIMSHAHSEQSNWSPLPTFSDYIKQVVRDVKPVELIGEPGDVIFWHGRTVHSSGIHIGTNIRWALFGDLMRDEPVLSEDEHRAVGQYEWFKDTRLLQDDAGVSYDLWNNWRLEPSR